MGKLVIDSTLCTGCLNCQTVCALVKSKAHTKSASAIRVNLEIFSGKHSHIYCRQCVDAECERVCPVGAIARDLTTGALLIDSKICIQCKLCVDACPFTAMFWDSEASMPFKCDLCGGNPACVEACNFGVFASEGSLK